MLILGISGGLDRPRRTSDRQKPMALDTWLHDSAAVLVKDGRVLAAIEEERINRIKHSGHRPEEAIHACCRQAGVSISDIDRIAYFMDEQNFDVVVGFRAMLRPRAVGAHPSGRSFLAAALSASSGAPIDERRLRFVEHHRCHAMSAWVTSGFDESLVLTLDGEGDLASGSVHHAHGRSLDVLRKMPVRNSLGALYTQVTRLLGFKPRDEFKVMGLAPYGDPETYESVFDQLVTLQENGEIVVHHERLPLMLRLFQPRRAHEPMTADHHHLAASLQRTLENAVLHLLRHFRHTTGLHRLCLAGGVAQNCAMTGVIERSGLFDEVSVCFASHDAGCALGAAMAVDLDEVPAAAVPPRNACFSPFLGLPIDEATVEARLQPWAPLVQWHRPDDVVTRSADLLAEGKVLGWMQGRSEFGPRALGHRSILADARPAANKDRVNAMVKKREAFRPFAPSVPLEHAARFFEVEEGREYPTMGVVVKVREDRRALLGAITHVDGTARLQTVTRGGNERFWELLQAFGARTGTPVLLNTSFNNNCEPIVDKLEDGLACLLTTGIDQLVVGSIIVSRRNAPSAGLLRMAVQVPPYLELRLTHGHDDECGRVARYLIANDYSDKYYRQVEQEVSEPVYRLLLAATPDRSIGALLDSKGRADEDEAVVAELLELWGARLVEITATRVRMA